MASQSQPAPPPGLTTITGLGDDLLREIFLRLPDLPTLVRAAFSCRTFRRAARSSPAFRRSFRALHAPPLLALFLEPNMEVVPVLPSRRRSSDQSLLAPDFFGIHTSRDQDPRATGWEIQSWNPSGEGYLILVKERASYLETPKWRAAYSPLTQALHLTNYHPDYISFELYTLPSQDGQGPSGVVCIHHERRSAESTAVVFSSDTMEWDISRRATLGLPEPARFRTTMVVRGLICWRDWADDQIVLFDTATRHFSLIDLPTPLKTESDESTYKLGDTKDQRLCIVDIQDGTLVSWFMTANDDERWTMYKNFSLHLIVEEFTGCSIEEEDCRVRVDIVAIIDGFVFLSIFYRKDTAYFEVYLSLCLETSEITELFHGAYRHNEEAHPYVMAWPPSLVPSKEESETEFTGDTVANDRPVCTEQASTVLVTALQSFSQTLINDGDGNKEIVAELDGFLHPTQDGEGSLIRKMTTLDAQLRTARDRILRISA
uniref:Uncharacterized protein n=1 Tax=Avena sativa TaxID=4498 RepID=A0ACD5X9V9_AVESA